MAMARSRPVFTCGMVTGTAAKLTWIWPPSKSVSAGPDPLYGTCVICVPAIRSKSSVARWVSPPTPDVP